MSLEDFKKLHSELGQALEDHDSKNQKLYGESQEILSDMYKIAKESERVADVARDVPKKLERKSRLKKYFIVILIILAAAVKAVDYVVDDKLLSFIIVFALLLATYAVRYIWKRVVKKYDDEKIFEEIRNKIRG